MWISRYRWESLVQRVERCEKAIRDQRKERGEDYGTTVQTAVYSERSIKDITY